MSPLRHIKDTDKVSGDIVAWQNRPLNLSTYCLDDGIVFKVREKLQVINKPFYMAVGLRRRAQKK